MKSENLINETEIKLALMKTNLNSKKYYCTQLIKICS